MRRFQLHLALAWAASLAEGTAAPEWSNHTRAMAFPYDPVAQSPPSSLYPALGRGSKRPDGCPPCPECFNCQLPRFECKQFGECSEFDGQCKCPEGFGGQDCGEPLCGSLADGDKRHPRGPDEASCACPDGWAGVNCNVCTKDSVCKPLLPPEDGSRGRPGYQGQLTTRDASGDDGEPSSDPYDGAVCYKEGFAVKRMYQMCDVTNKQIVGMLPGRPPQVSFTCDSPSATCQFQFWIGSVESFYCELEECSQGIDVGYGGGANVTTNECQKVKCKCIPDRMLCGESGSVDIGDFLRESIKGPGKFSCSSDGSGCKFEENAMNELISSIFGDDYISLDCQAGECMHYTMVPGFTVPGRPDNRRMVAASIALVGVIVIAASLLFWYLGRTYKDTDYQGRIRLPTEENGALMANHVPASLYFNDISYAVTGKRILDHVSGGVKAGQVLAIIGASGAGKSTFLDLLARKNKRGVSGGKIFVNGREVPENKYRRFIGYVDQEDTLMPTLTVYETVLHSAMLRLPRTMSIEAKKLRTLDTLQELGILHIKDSRIGEAGKRSISGGEKRRVSIACELVTSPRILFLDEMTSGLDATNALNVVESLVTLARKYQRTIVFTIHQPRSNIVALFDQLVLLAKGKVIYSGEVAKCQRYFEDIGHPCPPGFNIADFLLDLTMQDELSESATSCLQDESTAEEGTAMGLRLDAQSDEGTELTDRSGSHEHRSSIRSWASRTFAKSGGEGNSKQPSLPQTSRRVATLARAYADGPIAAELKAEMAGLGESEDVAENGAEEAAEAGGYQKATLWTQFTILSGRAFKNLYRNPMLMLAHYILALVLALICSGLFHGVTLDIGGFQGRMGLFFFILALFGFSSLTSIGVFSSERILFMRERSNGYYSPITYFASKVLFDVIPLRVVPPFILGAIIYGPIGLVPTVQQFWQFLLVLITFNLVASSAVLLISIVIADTGVANLLGSLVMLFNLLFAGLLINREKLPFGTGWLQDASFFHAAFEALLVNEVRHLKLKDHRYGVDIEVPSATILSLFGFRTKAFWWPDMATLVAMFVGFTGLSCLALIVLVRERR